MLVNRFKHLIIFIFFLGLVIGGVALGEENPQHSKEGNPVKDTIDQLTSPEDTKTSTTVPIKNSTESAKQTLTPEEKREQEKQFSEFVTNLSPKDAKDLLPKVIEALENPELSPDKKEQLEGLKKLLDGRMNGKGEDKALPYKPVSSTKLELPTFPQASRIPNSSKPNQGFKRVEAASPKTNTGSKAYVVPKDAYPLPDSINQNGTIKENGTELKGSYSQHHMIVDGQEATVVGGNHTFNDLSDQKPLVLMPISDNIFYAVPQIEALSINPKLNGNNGVITDYLKSNPISSTLDSKSSLPSNVSEAIENYSSLSENDRVNLRNNLVTLISQTPKNEMNKAPLNVMAKIAIDIDRQIISGSPLTNIQKDKALESYNVPKESSFADVLLRLDSNRQDALNKFNESYKGKVQNPISELESKMESRLPLAIQADLLSLGKHALEDLHTLANLNSWTEKGTLTEKARKAMSQLAYGASDKNVSQLLFTQAPQYYEQKHRERGIEALIVEAINNNDPSNLKVLLENPALKERLPELLKENFETRLRLELEKAKANISKENPTGLTQEQLLENIIKNLSKDPILRFLQSKSGKDSSDKAIEERVREGLGALSEARIIIESTNQRQKEVQDTLDLYQKAVQDGDPEEVKRLGDIIRGLGTLPPDAFAHLNELDKRWKAQKEEVDKAVRNKFKIQTELQNIHSNAVEILANTESSIRTILFRLRDKNLESRDKDALTDQLNDLKERRSSYQSLIGEIQIPQLKFDIEEKKREFENSTGLPRLEMEEEIKRLNTQLSVLENAQTKPNKILTTLTQTISKGEKDPSTTVPETVVKVNTIYNDRIDEVKIKSPVNTPYAEWLSKQDPIIVKYILAQKERDKTDEELKRKEQVLESIESKKQTEALRLKDEGNALERQALLRNSNGLDKIDPTRIAEVVDRYTNALMIAKDWSQKSLIPLQGPNPNEEGRRLAKTLLIGAGMKEENAEHYLTSLSNEALKKRELDDKYLLALREDLKKDGFNFNGVDYDPTLSKPIDNHKLGAILYKLDVASALSGQDTRAGDQIRLKLIDAMNRGYHHIQIGKDAVIRIDDVGEAMASLHSNRTNIEAAMASLHSNGTDVSAAIASLQSYVSDIKGFSFQSRAKATEAATNSARKLESFISEREQIKRRVDADAEQKKIDLENNRREIRRATYELEKYGNVIINVGNIRRNVDLPAAAFARGVRKGESKEVLETAQAIANSMEEEDARFRMYVGTGAAVAAMTAGAFFTGGTSLLGIPGAILSTSAGVLSAGGAGYITGVGGYHLSYGYDTLISKQNIPFSYVAAYNQGVRGAALGGATAGFSNYYRLLGLGSKSSNLLGAVSGAGSVSLAYQDTPIQFVDNVGRALVLSAWGSQILGQAGSKSLIGATTQAAGINIGTSMSVGLAQAAMNDYNYVTSAGGVHNLLNNRLDTYLAILADNILGDVYGAVKAGSPQAKERLQNAMTTGKISPSGLRKLAGNPQFYDSALSSLPNGKLKALKEERENSSDPKTQKNAAELLDQYDALAIARQKTAETTGSTLNEATSTQFKNIYDSAVTQLTNFSKVVADYWKTYIPPIKPIAKDDSKLSQAPSHAPPSTVKVQPEPPPNLAKTNPPDYSKQSMLNLIAGAYAPNLKIKYETTVTAVSKLWRKLTGSENRETPPDQKLADNLDGSDTKSKTESDAARKVDLHNHLMGILKSAYYKQKVGGTGSDAAVILVKAVGEGFLKDSDLQKEAPHIQTHVKKVLEKMKDLPLEDQIKIAEKALPDLFSATNKTPYNEPYSVIDTLIKKHIGYHDFLKDTIRELSKQGVEYTEQSVSLNKLSTGKFTEKMMREVHEELKAEGIENPTDVKFLAMLSTEVLAGQLSPPKLKEKLNDIIKKSNQQGIDMTEKEALATLSKNDLSSNIIDPEILKTLEQILLRSDVIGVDFASPEKYGFSKVGMENFQQVYLTVLEVWKTRDKPLVVRPHVGEGYPESKPTSERTFTGRKDPIRNKNGDPTHEDVARTNIEIMLNQIGEMQRLGLINPKKVDLRLGHLTHMTPEQASRLPGLDVTAEMNLTSNSATGAGRKKGAYGDDGTTSRFENHGLLPALNVIGPEGIVRIVTATDGNGVMHSSLSSELNAATQAIERFKRGEIKVEYESGKYATYQELQQQETQAKNAGVLPANYVTVEERFNVNRLNVEAQRHLDRAAGNLDPAGPSIASKNTKAPLGAETSRQWKDYADWLSQNSLNPTGDSSLDLVGPRLSAKSGNPNISSNLILPGQKSSPPVDRPKLIIAGSLPVAPPNPRPLIIPGEEIREQKTGTVILGSDGKSIPTSKVSGSRNDTSLDTDGVGNSSSVNPNLLNNPLTREAIGKKYIVPMTDKIADGSMVVQSDQHLPIIRDKSGKPMVDPDSNEKKIFDATLIVTEELIKSGAVTDALFGGDMFHRAQWERLTPKEQRQLMKEFYSGTVRPLRAANPKVKITVIGGDHDSRKDTINEYRIMVKDSDGEVKEQLDSQGQLVVLRNPKGEVIIPKDNGKPVTKKLSNGEDKLLLDDRKSDYDYLNETIPGVHFAQFDPGLPTQIRLTDGRVLEYTHIQMGASPANYLQAATGASDPRFVPTLKRTPRPFVAPLVTELNDASLDLLTAVKNNSGKLGKVSIRGSGDSHALTNTITINPITGEAITEFNSGTVAGAADAFYPAGVMAVLQPGKGPIITVPDGISTIRDPKTGKVVNVTGKATGKVKQFLLQQALKELPEVR